MDGRRIGYCRPSPAEDYGVRIYLELEMGLQRMHKTVYDKYEPGQYDPGQHGRIYPHLDKEGRENRPSTTGLDCRRSNEGVPMNVMGVGLG